MTTVARAPGDEAGGRLRVVYLAGAQHCGSTMLDAILGNAPGARSLGEVGGFHRYRTAAACDCRQPPASCSPCAAAVAALEREGRLDEYHERSPQPLKERRLHWTVLPTRGRRRYAETADVILSAVAADTGARVLVDSSKNASRAAALAHDSRHDVRVVHLVRDGRGYVRSRARRRGGRPVRPLPLALAPWVGKNLLITLALRRLPRHRVLRVRHEDLVADPAGELERLGRFTGLDTSALAAAALGDGLRRRHLFEPRRMVDYRLVQLDPSRGRADAAPRAGRWYWLSGGWVSRLWGYSRHGPVRPVEVVRG